MVGGEIKVVMTLDDSNFSVKTIKNGQVISDMGRTLDQSAKSAKNVENHFVKLGNQFERTIFTVSMLRYALHDVHDIFLALPSAILKSAGEMERMTMLLKGMSTATDEYGRKAEAASNVKFIFNLAQNAPFEVKALTDSFVKMKSAGIDPTKIAMQALTDSVAKFGGGTEQLQRASIAIQQMAGKGVISMEELRQQLGEAVPNAINLMAEGAGMSMAKFTKLVSTGTVEATGALNNMFAAMIVQNYGAASSMMNTWTGMLALLKTKFELFKISIAGDGDTDFFGEAKASLKEMIESFNGMNARSLANEIGQTLASAVRGLREVIDFTVKWWDSIKLAGQALLFYFAADKLVTLTSAFRKTITDRIGLYKLEIAEQESAKANKLRNIVAEIAAEESAFAKKQAIIVKTAEAEAARAAKEASSSIATMEKQRALLAKQLADRVQHYQQLGALQQQFLAKQMAAELEAEAQLRRKKAGSSAAAAASSAEAIRIANNAAVLSGSANSTKAEIEAIKAKEKALLAAITATRNHTVANTADAAISAITAEHLKKTTALLDQKAIASTAAALSVGMLSRAMTGVSMVFNAFGGWIAVAITGLALLGEKLYDFLKSWERAEEISKKIRKGIAAATDEEALKPKVAALDERIAKDEAFFKKTQRPQDVPEGTDRATKRVFEEAQKDYDARKAQYNADIALRAKYIDDLAESKRLLKKEDDESDIRAYRSKTMDSIKASMQAQTAELVKLRNEKQDAELKLREDGATSDQIEKATKDITEKITAKNKESISLQVKALTSEQERLKNLLKTAGESEKSKINGMLEQLTDEKAGLLTQFNNYEKAMANFGTLPSSSKKPEPQKAESPLVRRAESLKAQVEEAKLKLQATINQARGLKQLEQEAMMSVLGDLASGKLDQSLGKDPNTQDSYLVRSYVGGIEERKKYVQMFLDYLKSGKSDIQEFTKGLSGLTERQKEYVLELVQGETLLKELPQLQKAITEANAKAAQSQVTLNSAKERYADGISSKVDSAFLREERGYSVIQEKLLAVTDAFKEYMRMKGESLTNVASAEIYANALTNLNALKTTEIEYNAMWQTAAEKRQAVYEKERKLINDKYADEIRNLIKYADAEKDADKIKESIAKAQAGRDTALTNASKKDEISRQLGLEKLSKDWSDTTEQMNNVTTKWASSVTDSIVQATTTGSADWGKMAMSMATDLQRVLVQRTMSGGIDAMLGSFGGAMKGLLGGATKTASDVAGGATKAATDTVAATPVNTMAAAATAATAALNAMTAAATGSTVATQADTVATQLSTTATVTDATAEQASTVATILGSATEQTDTVANVNAAVAATGLASALTAAAAASTANSFFAMGGIMSSAGSLPLNMYANGGVANRPQMAIFGEGRMPEAYVPLPDGRSIPVTMKSSQATSDTQSQNGTTVNISIAVTGEGGDESSKSSGDSSSAWTPMANKIKALVVEEMIKQSRPGGMSYRG